MRALSVLAFEAFDAGSHRAVREAIERHSRHRWTWVTLPGRAWKWRLRLGAIELIDRARAAGALDGPVDAIFATSMCSVADLVALLPRPLRSRPSILYMHENQAAYPAQPGREDQRDVHFALTNLTSVRAADVTVWNSAWNRASFESALASILTHATDDTTRRVSARGDASSSMVVWPPVEFPASLLPRVLHNPEQGSRVVWPHRWEHDKGPEELLEIAERWTEPLGLRWILLGERFRQTPPALDRFLDRFGTHIEHAGHVADRADYWRWLSRADWVLSTARHEFFGVAVVEALLAGCLPWLPARLSYPELLPAVARDLAPSAPPDDPEAVRRAVERHLEPALAPNAVAALDEIVANAVAGSVSSTPL